MSPVLGLDRKALEQAAALVHAAMPPRILNAPVAVWFSCLTQTSQPARWLSSGQDNCAVGGMAA
jgi:hypothetical protein